MHMRGALLFVKNLARMREFYSEILGTPPTNQACTDTWASFDSDVIRFALHAIPPVIAANIEITSPPTPRETDPIKLIFEVDDVESMRTKLESLGAQTIRRAWQRPGVACDAVDPEGNIFQICSSDDDTLQ